MITPAHPNDTWKQAPRLWRFFLHLARIVIPLLCRIKISGDIPTPLRPGGVILASNHIGLFDPVALATACAQQRLAPRILATAGLLHAPGLGSLLARCGHIGVDRRKRGGDSLQVAEKALDEGAILVMYPEGRITLDPGGWPERGKTGVVRLAHATSAVIVPVAQWGAHEVLAYTGIGANLARLCRALFRRPIIRVHFGPPINIDEFAFPRESGKAANAVMTAIANELRTLRTDEAALPRFIDPSRPVSTQYSLRTPDATHRHGL